MDNNSLCRELFLDDIVKLELFPAAQCQFPLPANIPLSEMTGATFGAPALSIDLTGDADVQAAELPTLKVSTGRSVAGLVYNQELQVSVLHGAEVASKAVASLQGSDFHVVYTKADGTRWLSYSLWNTSLADIDDTHAASRACMVKIKLSSMSNLIALL